MDAVLQSFMVHLDALPQAFTVYRGAVLQAFTVDLDAGSTLQARD